MSRNPNTKTPEQLLKEMMAAAHNPPLLKEMLKFAGKLCGRFWFVRAFGKPEIRCFKDPSARKSHVRIVVFYFHCEEHHIHLNYRDLNRNITYVNIRTLDDFNNIKQTVIDGYNNF
ncbi:MAG: hypothetical protein FWC26_00830 [Fibromonadales bacterium]|nr:hypothetical protein [Fibromonadales bacterium]